MENYKISLDGELNISFERNIYFITGKITFANFGLQKELDTKINLLFFDVSFAETLLEKIGGILKNYSKINWVSESIISTKCRKLLKNYFKNLKI